MRRFTMLAAMEIFLWATAAFSTTLYNNTVLTNTASGLTGSQSTIQIDDVLVPSSRNPFNSALAISSITVEVLGSGVDDFSIYIFPVKSDGTPDPNFHLIETVPVTFTSPVQLVTFSAPSGTLVTVNPNFTTQPGFGLLYIGLSATGDATDWVWANGPDYNLPTAYLDNLSAHQIFLNTSPGPPFPPNFSFYLNVQGAPVPEPASFSFVTSGIITLTGVVRRRRRP